MQAHGQFAQAVDHQSGKILGGEALQPTATATSLRDDGQAVADGPFVETKEALGGFYLIEAADLDQALAFAKLCPAQIMRGSGRRRFKGRAARGRGRGHRHQRGRPADPGSATSRPGGQGPRRGEGDGG